MIPKIIHLCWLSGDPFPTDIVRCLETWNDKLKDYTIWLWGKAPSDLSVTRNLKLEVKEFDLNSTVWTRQAFEAKKYAFAADYIRLYALYNYGGIYLDADVLVYKPFDELLSLPYFIGCDQIRAFEAAVIGAEKGCKWIKDVLDTLENRQFIQKDGSFERIPLPVRFHHELIAKKYVFKKLISIGDFNTNTSNKTLQIFDADYFNSRNAVKVRKTHKSFCAHNYASSWEVKKKSGIKNAIKRLMPDYLLHFVYTLGQKTWSRNKYAYFQINFEK